MCLSQDATPGSLSDHFRRGGQQFRPQQARQQYRPITIFQQVETSRPFEVAFLLGPRMDKLNLFIPITKIDQAQRLVYGVATAEQEDRAGEVCDYASTKPFYEKWSGDIEKATDGKSLGNLRAMHGKVAAGKVTAINFNDDAKQIEICAKVVDDSEWKKVEEGVYTGFSQGGAYVKRWQDDAGLQRYTADPNEVSLVDMPCLPTATFSVIKADGVIEEHHFKAGGDGDIEKKWTVTSTNTAGNDHSSSHDTKAAADAEAKDRKDKGHTKVKVKGSSDDGDGADNEGAADESAEKLWKSKRDGSEHPTLEALRAHHTQLDADEAAQKAAAPALDALAEMAGALGIEKKDYSEDARSKMADSGQAMSDGSFPIKTRADLENAVKAFGRAKDPAAAKKHIIERAKTLGATDMLPPDWPGSTAKAGKVINGPMLKGLDACARLACLIQELEWLQQGAAWESTTEGDASPLPGELAQNIAGLCATLRAMVQEETAELAQGIDVDPAQMDDSPLAAAAGKLRSNALAALSKIANPAIAPILEKAGARNSKGDAAKIQSMHDNAVDLGATCGGSADKAAHSADLAKALVGKDAEIAAEKSRADTLQRALDLVAEDVKRLAAAPRPLPYAAGTRAVSKSEDNGGQDPKTLEQRFEQLSRDEQINFVMKHAPRISNPALTR